MNIVAIVQARLTSTRLPGKVLKEIEGKPMLWHVVNRLSFSRLINRAVVAIPDTPSNDALASWLDQQQIPYVRGSEDNVLSRYVEAATKHHADIIVRVTSDCPFIDPGVLDQIIKAHSKSRADYTSNVMKRTFPRGLDVEVFNKDVLDRAHSQATNSHQREHVTPYMYEHPEMFKLHSLEAEGILRRSDMRLTVDEQADLDLIKKIYQRLYRPGKLFSAAEAVAAINENPILQQINAMIQQKSL